jgi:hypothetical protein
MRLEMLAFEAVLLLHLVCSISSDVVQVPSTINLNSYLGEGRCISGTGQCLEMWLRRYDWEGILWSARKAASVRREMIHGLDPNSCTCGWATLVCWSPLVNHDYHDYPSSKLPGRQQQPQKWEVVSLKLGKKKIHTIGPDSAYGDGWIPIIIPYLFGMNIHLRPYTEPVTMHIDAIFLCCSFACKLSCFMIVYPSI